VIDATSVTAYARRSLARRASAAGIPAIAIVLDLDDSLVLARNATRPGRIVPEAVVRRQLGDLARSIRRGLDDDGFQAIHVIRTAEEQDALLLDRGPAAAR
jgi:protein phosphatase